MNLAFLDSLTGFVNSLTGLGGSRDKGAVGSWFFTPLSDTQLESEFRSNWYARKAVTIPAFDMVRAGWQHQAEGDAIEKIELAERRLRLTRLVFEALVAARLYGGSGIIIGDGADDPRRPLDIERMPRGGLQYLTVLSRRYLIAGELDRDPLSPNYLEPMMYQIGAATTGSQEIHPSRVIRFTGAYVPDLQAAAGDQRWGDSILDAVDIAIRDATQGQAGIAALIQEAKVDILKIPNLADKVSTADYQNRLVNRVDLMQRGKGIVNSAILDSEEEWEQKQINFSALPDVARFFVQVVAGAVDIPVTRFLGESPAGLSSTGESDLRNYYDRVNAEQRLSLEGPLARLLQVVLQSELGMIPPDWWFEFNPLWQMSEKERAEVGKLEAEEDQLHVNNGTVPMPVLVDAVKNRLIERGNYPGIEGAYDDFGELGEFAAEPEPEPVMPPAAPAPPPVPPEE